MIVLGYCIHSTAVCFVWGPTYQCYIIYTLNDGILYYPIVIYDYLFGNTLFFQKLISLKQYTVMSDIANESLQHSSSKM